MKHIIDDSRRDFLTGCMRAVAGVTVIGIAAAATGGCSTASVARTAQGTVEFDVSSLTADNQALVADVTGPDGSPVLIVRRSAGVYLALSMRCTHKGCDVEPPKEAVLVCPCHNSRFDLAGAVVKGPATVPLARYPLTYNSETGQVAVKFS